MIATILAELLLFMPGILLLELISRVRNIKIGVLEKVISGSVLWNYVFALSTLAGLIPSGLKFFFPVFQYMSLGVLGISSAILILLSVKRGFKFKKTIRCYLSFSKSLQLSILLFLAFSVTFTSIIAINVPISGGWDIWAVWLPRAKSIAESGDLISSTYVYSPLPFLTSCTPVMPLINAWTLVLTGRYGSFYPIIYYVLLGIVVFELTRHTFKNLEISYGSLLAYVCSPSVFSVLFTTTLYADSIAVFFFYTAFLYFIKMISEDEKSSKAPYLIFFGMSISLLCWTREVGLFLGYLASSFLLFLSPFPTRAKKLLFVIFWCGGFLLLYHMSQSSNLVLLQMLALYVCFLVFILVRLPIRDRGKSFQGARNFLQLAITILPTLLFFIIIGLSSGRWFYVILDPKIGNEYQTFITLFAHEQTESTQPSLLKLIRVDDIMLRYFFLPYSIPLILGIRRCLKNKELEKHLLLILLITFFSVFLMRNWNYYPSLCPPDYSFVRRLFLALPLLCIMSSIGMNGKSIEKNASLLRSLFYFPMTTAYIFSVIRTTWPRPFEGLLNVSRMCVSVGGYASLNDFLCIIILLLGCYGFSHIIIRIKQRWASIRGFICSGLLILLVIFNNLALLYTFLSIPLQDSIENGSILRLKPPRWAEDVVWYFNSISLTTDTKNFYVMGFTINYLATFSEIKVISLTSYHGYMTFKEIFNCSNYLEKLKSFNVKYVILPKENHPWDFNLFQKYMEFFPAFEEFKETSLELQKSLNSVDIYLVKINMGASLDAD